MTAKTAKRVISYKAEPTLRKLHRSKASVKAIMGPIGSGKSVGCVIEMLEISKRQKPCKDGIRRTRWAVIRNTYPELKSTTLNTWKEWIPEDICPITYGAPIEANMYVPCGDGTDMHMQVYFLALDRPKDVKKLLSLELTGVWINEARELDVSIVTAARSRTGRFPSKRDCDEITWTGLLMDTNPPDNDHWWYNLAENVKPAGWDFFKQAGALKKVVNKKGQIVGYEANPDAENVQNHHLGYDYWMRMTGGADPEWVSVHCCGEYGSVFTGKPVYKDVYNDSFHASEMPLGLYRGMPIVLGWDYGLTPACVIGQVSPTGQLRILREYVCKRGGIKQFASDVVIPALGRLFPNNTIVSYGDPAGEQKSQADDTLSCHSMLEDLGLPTSPAATNDFMPRRQAVLDRLTRNIDGEPAILIDPSCIMVRRGFIGGYKFERVQISGEEARFKDQPAKNKFSHPHDALQYLVLGVDYREVEEVSNSAPPPVISW